MAYYPFNGTTMTFAGDTYEVTSFSMEGGNRAEIDVTHSGSTRRKSIPGMASPKQLTFGFNYAGDASTLDTKLSTCTPGDLVVNMGAGCDAVAAHITVKAWLMSWDLAADLDGITTGNFTFMVEEPDTP